MIKKKPVKKSKLTSVTFETDQFQSAATISLVGEFNDWEPASTPMKRRKDGSWSVTMRLAKLPDKTRYEYRFVVDGKTWVPDAKADELVTNPYGEQNSVVVLG